MRRRSSNQTTQTTKKKKIQLPPQVIQKRREGTMQFLNQNPEVFQMGSFLLLWGIRELCLQRSYSNHCELVSDYAMTLLVGLAIVYFLMDLLESIDQHGWKKLSPLTAFGLVSTTFTFFVVNRYSAENLCKFIDPEMYNSNTF